MSIVLGIVVSFAGWFMIWAQVPDAGFGNRKGWMIIGGVTLAIIGNKLFS